MTSRENTLYEEAEQRPKTSNISITLARTFDLLVRTGVEHPRSRIEREHPNRARVSYSSSPASTAFRQYHSAVLK